MSTYYVSPAGSDSAAGGTNTPWKTLQHAADRVVAGDTVDVRAGNYAGWVMGWDFVTAGTANAPITFQAEPGAIIDTRDNKTADGIDLEPGCDYITIEGFTVNNASGTITRAGIRVTGSNHVIVRNNVADHNGTWGIFTAFADDILIENNVASNTTGQHGIYFSNSGDRPIIRGNTVFGNHDAGIHMNGDVSQGGDGIISDALVEDNVIYNNGTGGGSAINCDGVQNSVFRNNLLYNNHASGISLYQIDAAEPAMNNLIINNTIIQASDARWAINITDGSTGNHVYNNILYNNQSYRGSMNVESTSLPGFKSDYNVVMDRFSTDGGDSIQTLAQWRAATGQDAHSIIATPAQLFVNLAANDYHLSATSPAIDVGTSTNAPPTDLESNPRPSGLGVDIGAYEKQIASNPGGTWQETTQADFNAGILSGTTITNSDGGEVQLAPVFFDSFQAGPLSNAWLNKPWVAHGGVKFTGGMLSISGTQIRTVQPIAQNPVEGLIRFTGADQDFGLATNLASAPGNDWAMFGTKAQKTILYARVRVAGSMQDVNLGRVPAGFHDYRIQPASNSIAFFIDGKLKATMKKSIPISTALRLTLSATQVAPQFPLQAQWVQADSFVSGGTFSSSVFDAGQTVTWGVANWSAMTPAGTSLVVETESGNTATPDGSWSQWSAVTNNSAVASPAGRYLRYRVTFVTTNPAATAVLFNISFVYT